MILLRSRKLYDVIQSLTNYLLYFLETAMLLPGKYASKNLRSGKQKYDVRSNLKSYRQREGKQ